VQPPKEFPQRPLMIEKLEKKEENPFFGLQVYKK